MFLSRGYGYVGELLDLQQGCEGTFRGPRGKVISLETPQQKGLISSEGDNLLVSHELWQVPLEL